MQQHPVKWVLDVLLRCLWKQAEGQDMVEYALAAGFVAVDRKSVV